MAPSRNQKAYVCLHVFEGSHPVKLVIHDDDGWCFLCGDLHPDTAESYRVVGAGHLFDRDPTLREIEDLELNHEAERQAIGEKWVVTSTVMN